MKLQSIQGIKQLFKKFNSLKVFVVGDAMLDKYQYGNIDRISPEAPVPVVSISHKDTRLGGAANVAFNCKAMGADVFLLTVVGNDENGNEFLNLLKKEKIKTDFCLQSKNRVTTTKTRVIAKKQQIIRLDEEQINDLHSKDEHHFIDICLKAIQIETPDILIFEDYNKGVLTELVIKKILEHCKYVGVMTCVDPKEKNFFTYQQVDLFKPNWKEVREALQLKDSQIKLKKLNDIHRELFQKLQHQCTMITLSEHGIFVEDDKNACLLPTHIRQIADVSGAGDTVIAVASLIYFVSRNLEITAKISNIAGGLVCEKLGVVSIDKEQLLKEVSELYK